MKPQNSFGIIAICFAFVLNCCFSERIVVLYPFGSKSHFYAVMPVIQELAKRGHQLTVFSAFEGITNKTTNVNEVFLPNIARKLEESNIDWFAMQKQGSTQFLSIIFKITDFAGFSCETLLTNLQFRRIVEERDVDLFIVDSLGGEFTFPVIEKIGVPFVIHSSSGAVPPTLAAMGAPIDYASVPTVLTEFDNKMTFSQRLQNIMSFELREYPGVRLIQEVEGEASLYITNTHAVTNWPRSLPPTILSIGALHARPAKPLPPDFKTFADEAKDGFIVFTLGSFVSVSSMPKELVDTFIRVFSKIPQKIIWKWETDMPENTPENVKMVDWLPQQDLLGHPNARLFITHGGMLGTQESIYHGVPLLGLPFGNDQRANVAKAVKDGWALKFDWDKVNDQTLGDAINHLLHDSNVQESTSRISRVIRDEIIPGKDVATYWIEYVLRHNGTKHLQVAAKNMPFYKQNLIDIAFFLLTILLIILFFVITMMRLVIRNCTSVKREKLKTK